MEKYLTCEQIAERYGVKVTTVWAWIRGHKLTAVKTGKNYSVAPDDLKKFEKDRRTIQPDEQTEEQSKETC